MNPAIKEERRIVIFVPVMSPSSLNAKRVIKIDMVNPIPPKKLAPIICFHFKSDGKAQIPTNTAENENKQIPKGFPMTKPINTPMLFGCHKLGIH